MSRCRIGTEEFGPDDGAGGNGARDGACGSGM